MNDLTWNYNKCVACGNCLKACYEQNSKVLCQFDTELSGNKLYNWVCKQQNKQSCGMACKQICTNKAIL